MWVFSVSSAVSSGTDHGGDTWTVVGVTKYRYHLIAEGREVAEADFTNSGGGVTESNTYVLRDHLGSVDVVTDASGPPLAQMSFCYRQ